MLQATTQSKGPLRRKGVIEVQDSDIKTDMKSLSRLEIQNTVFDNSDSIADNAKMISLMMTTMTRFYSMFTEDQKATLSPEDRGMIEYTFNKFATTNTRADVQFSIEGIALVDKLLDRQADIGSIIKETYKI